MTSKAMATTMATYRVGDRVIEALSAVEALWAVEPDADVIATRDAGAFRWALDTNAGERIVQRLDEEPAATLAVWQPLGDRVQCIACGKALRATSATARLRHEASCPGLRYAR